MKILITGGSGFIGTNLIDYYSSKGVSLLNIDIKPPQKNEHLPSWREADIRNEIKLNQLVSDFQPDYVLHMAAKADLTGKSLFDYSSNIKGVENLINICNEVHSIKKVIFTSTMLVCKVGYIPSDDNDYCPPNLYGESKMIGENLVKENGNKHAFKWIIIRPTSIWGPWFGPTYRGFFELILKKRYFNFSGKMSNKTYGYIGNSVYQIDCLLMSETNNERVFYIGDYLPTNIKEWAIEIAKEKQIYLYTIPRLLIWIAALVGDILKYFKLKFPMNSFRLGNMTTDNILPLNNTQKHAPLTPFTRIEGNRLTIQWMENYYLKNNS